MATSVTTAPPTWIDGVTVHAEALRRQLLGAVYPGEGIVRGLRARALPTPAMAVRLPPGLALVADGTGGMYSLDLTTQVDLDIAASHITLPRRDALAAIVIDEGDDTSTYEFRVLTGTPAAVPVLPSLPAGAAGWVLADIAVRPGAESSGNIRAEDVTIVAPDAVLGAGPWMPVGAPGSGVTFAPGIRTSTGTDPAQVRHLPDGIELRGRVQRIDGQPLQHLQPLVVLDEDQRPDRVVYHMAAATQISPHQSVRVECSSSGGTVIPYLVTGYSPTWVSLDGWRIYR